MKLTEEDKQLISNWIGEKCGVMRCTCCGHANWELVGISTLPIGFDLRTTRYYYAQGLPQVSIACTNCAHLLFFSPAIMGITPNKPEEKETNVAEAKTDISTKENPEKAEES